MNGSRFNMIGLRGILAGAAIAAMLAATPTAVLALGAGDDEENVVVYRLGGDKGKAKKLIVTPGDEKKHVISESHSIQVVLEDGKPKVVIDGKEIPADKLKMKEGHVIILGDDGEEVRTIELGPDLEGLGTFSFDFGDDEKFITVGPGEWKFLGQEHPKVMMGVNLDVPGPALEFHLRLDPDASTLIRGVHEDLPADEAGLEQYDIIVAIDGETPADPDSLRKVLADKEPGDVVELTIIHKGKKNKVEVELAEYDMELMIGTTITGDLALPFGFEKRFEIFDKPETRFLGRVPGLRDIVIDENKRFFEIAPELRMKMGDKWIDMTEDEADDGDLEKRLKSLNKRLAELEKLLDELLKEAERK